MISSRRHHIATSNLTMKTNFSRVDTLKNALISIGYSISEQYLDSDCLAGAFYCMVVNKTYGPDRVDCNGGYILINRDGGVRFDLYLGGCKYGTHMNSFLAPLHDGYVRDLPVVKILDFLSTK